VRTLDGDVAFGLEQVDEQTCPSACSLTMSSNADIGKTPWHVPGNWEKGPPTEGVRRFSPTVQHLRLEKRSVSVRRRTHVARRCEISGPLYQRLSRLRPALATSAMRLHSTCATSCTANVPARKSALIAAAACDVALWQARTRPPATSDLSPLSGVSQTFTQSSLAPRAAGTIR
jgi:hypothetical protein